MPTRRGLGFRVYGLAAVALEKEKAAKAIDAVRIDMEAQNKAR